MTKISMRLIFISAFFFFSCNQTSKTPESPKLVITLVVDQMRPDLLTRFDDIYTGGFRWLMDHGIWFTNTHHEHSYTATGPGHFSIGTGQYPGKVGLVGNSFYDRDLGKNVNCVEDPNATVVGAQDGEARSFRRYETTGLGDWVKETYEGSKVIAIGGKDRSAVLMGGRQPDLALYYNYAGSFISSDYYVDQLPSWVVDFNNQLNAELYKDSIWTKSLSDDIYLNYSREDFYLGELDDYLNDDYSPVFPIGIDPNEDPKASLMGRPWFEREILRLAQSAIVEEELGLDANPDLLFIGFSAMDWMIHNFGPFSQEIMDACIKLDKWLGNFIKMVDQSVGLENVLFVLTADHGGLPLPEYLQEKNQKAGRINKEHMQEADEWIKDIIEEQYGKKLYIRKGGNYYLDLKRLKKANINPRKIYKIIEEHLSKVEGIEEVVFKNDFIDIEGGDKITKRIQNMIHNQTADIFPIVSPGYIYKNPYGTGHGSPYDYDTHVPLIFSRKHFSSSLIDTSHATVDIAPTIAKIIDVLIPDFIDGKVINF